MIVTDEQRQKDLERLQALRPMDDDFMRCLFKDNIPLAELVLRIITGKQDLVITDCQTQKDMKRLAGARSICLDAYGTDSDDMNYELMAERTRYLKESQKGIQEMCQIMEDMRNEALEEGRKEGIKEAAINTAKRMIKRGKATLEEIAEDTDLTLSKIEELSANINKL